MTGHLVPSPATGNARLCPPPSLSPPLPHSLPFLKSPFPQADLGDENKTLRSQKSHKAQGTGRLHVFRKTIFFH